MIENDGMMRPRLSRDPAAATVPAEAWDHTHPDHDQWAAPRGRCYDPECPGHSSKAKAHPGPRLRPGRKNPRTLYLQMGDEPDETVDLPIGMLIDTSTARLIGEGLTSPWHLNEIRLDAEARCDEPRLDAKQEPQPADTYVGVRTEDAFMAEKWGCA